jgi:hypothetical protein
MLLFLNARRWRTAVSTVKLSMKEGRMRWSLVTTGKESLKPEDGVDDGWASKELDFAERLKG